MVFASVAYKLHAQTQLRWRAPDMDFLILLTAGGDAIEHFLQSKKESWRSGIRRAEHARSYIPKRSRVVSLKLAGGRLCVK